MNESVLIVKDIEKTYTTKSNSYNVLKKINFSVKKSEFVAIMGKSGSGKTTLLNIISGFLLADNGGLFLDGQNIINIKESILAEIRQNKIGFIFQDYMLIHGLTAKENIFLPQIIANKSIEEMKQTTKKLMQDFEIEHIADKYPSELSGGQKQRIAIARALSNQPLIILADEPTGNLDSKSSNAVMEAFLRAKNNFGATILMVTHDALAASKADRVIILSDGEIVKELIHKKSSKEFFDNILNYMSKEGENYDLK